MHNYILVALIISLFPGGPGTFLTSKPQEIMALRTLPLLVYVTSIPPGFNSLGYVAEYCFSPEVSLFLRSKCVEVDQVEGALKNSSIVIRIFL